MLDQNQTANALENIYIAPLESCNLNCRLCYTRKTKDRLNNDQIMEFINRYRTQVQLKSVLFCGGEVFTLPDFTELINQLLEKKIFLTIITNGTIDQLTEIKDPANCQLLVSLDGSEEIHDQNRGKGNFQKSIAFIKKALALGFPVEVMFLVTQESYPHRNSFPELVNALTGHSINVNYITQKTFFYTQDHPLANPKNQKAALTPEQILEIKKNYPSIPGKDFGCFQLALQANGLIYGCCEAPRPIARMSDAVEEIIKNFKASLGACQKCGLCRGCCSPDFLCGYAKELGVKNCKEVVELML